MSLKWTKLYNSEWLEGSIRVDLTPAERSVWTDLLALAGLSRREGYIERSQGIPYTVIEIAHRFSLCGQSDEKTKDGIELVQSTLSKCIAEGRIEVVDGGVYHITNWGKYQSVPDNVIARKRSIAKNQEDRRSLSQSVQANTRAVNRQTIATEKLKDKIRYIPNPENSGEVIDTNTGEIYRVEKT